MSSNSSSNNEESSTCCDGGGDRAVREIGQPPRQRGMCDPATSALTALPQLKPKHSQIVRYIVNHGGDLWTETRCTSHGALREDLHIAPPYPLGGVQERVPLKPKTTTYTLTKNNGIYTCYLELLSFVFELQIVLCGCFNFN